MSETEYYAEETDTPYTGAEGEEDEFPGRCIAVTSSGKRCPNQALEGAATAASRRTASWPLRRRESTPRRDGHSPPPVRRLRHAAARSPSWCGWSCCGGRVEIDRDRRSGGRGAYLCPDAPARAGPAGGARWPAGCASR